MLFCSQGVICMTCREQRRRYGDSLRAARFPGSNPGEGEIFCTSPDRPRGPPSLPYNKCKEAET